MTRFPLLNRLWFVRHRPRPMSRVASCAMVGCVLMLGLGACSKPLFPAGQPRTQYDRYDLVRNQYAPQYVTDEFGRQRPNLRARLLPKE